MFVTEEILCNIELWRTTALIYVNDRQYYTISRWASNQGSYVKPHATGVNRWSDCIGYRIEIVFQISILESLVKIPSSRLYEKKDGAFELTSLPPHPHVLLAFK